MSTTEIKTQMGKLRDAKQELKRREARRSWADGALAALPTTESSTGGALSAVDLALGRSDDAEVQDTSQGAVADDSNSAASDSHTGDDRVLDPLDEDVRSSLDVDAVDAGLGNSKASAPKSFKRAVEAGAALASLDADLLFPSGSSERHGSGAHTSQLGFASFGSGTTAANNHPEERDVAARIRKADPPADEVEDDKCRPPMVMFKGKCIDSPDLEPRPWGLPTRRQYKRSLARMRRYPHYRTRQRSYRRRYRRNWSNAQKRYTRMQWDQYHAKHKSDCVFPRVKKGHRCVNSPLREPHAWGLPNKPWRRYTPREKVMWKQADKSWQRGLKQSLPARERGAARSLIPRRRWEKGKKRTRHLIPQRFPQRRGSNTILGDNWISGANAGSGYPDGRLSPRKRWQQLRPASPFADHLVKNSPRSLRSHTPPLFRPFGHAHDHDLTHPFWTRKELRKYYRPEIKKVLRSFVPKLGRYVPSSEVQRQFHPRNPRGRPVRRHDRFRPLSKHPEEGIKPGSPSEPTGLATPEEQRIINGDNMFAPLQDDKSPAELVLAKKQ